MYHTAPILTNAGTNLLLRAIAGEHVTFTRFKVGDGNLDSGTGKDLTDLLHTVLTFQIAGEDRSQAGFLTVSGHFSSQDVTEEFRLRELGLFAKGEDNVEQLYCYINDGNGAGTMKPNGSSVLTEQEVSLVIAIGEAENISVELGEGILYAKKADFDAHTADEDNPHSVTAEQVGAAQAEHTHNTDDLTGGVLPVARGGTGAGTLAAFAAAFAPEMGKALFGLTPLADDVSVDSLTTPGIYYVASDDERESEIPFTPGATENYIDMLLIVYSVATAFGVIPHHLAISVSVEKPTEIKRRMHQIPLDSDNWTAWI